MEPGSYYFYNLAIFDCFLLIHFKWWVMMCGCNYLFVTNNSMAHSFFNIDFSFNDLIPLLGFISFFTRFKNNKCIS